MKVLKFLSIFVLCTVVINGVIYSCGAFVMWDMNVGKWTDSSRALLAFLFYVGLAIAAGISYASILKTEE